jgi:hypothetical protein
VLQALYAWDLRGEQALERVASQIWVTRPSPDAQSCGCTLIHVTPAVVPSSIRAEGRHGELAD